MSGFGSGISLQGKPDKDYDQLAYRMYGREDRQKAAQAKIQAAGRKQDETKISKYLHDIDIGDKVHRWYGDAARENMAGLMSDIEDAKEKYGEYNYMNHLQEPIAKRLSVAKELVRKSGPLKAEEKYYEAHGDQYTEPQKQMLQAMQIGTMDDAKKIQDPMGTVNMNEQGEVNFAKRLPTKFDIKKRASDFLDGLAKSNGSQIVSNVELPGTNGKRAIETGTFLPETPEDARAAEDKVFQETGKKVTFTDKQSALKEQFKGDPAIQAWYGELNREKYTKDSPLDFKDPKSNWRDKMADDYFNDHKGYGGQSFKRSIVAPVKNNASYNKGTGTGNNERFSAAPTSGAISGYGSHELSYIGTDGTKPTTIVSASHALDENGAPIKDFDGKVQGFIAGNKPLKNPRTGKWEQYFKVIIPEKPAGSTNESTTTKESDTKSKHSSSSTRKVQEIQEYWLPSSEIKGKVKTYAVDKKGNNFYMDDIFPQDEKIAQNLNKGEEKIKTEKVANSKEERRSKMKSIFGDK